MSGIPLLRGTALGKAKKEKRVLNFKKKKAAESAETSAVAMDIDVDNDATLPETSPPPDAIPSLDMSIVSSAGSNQGSPFLGFSPMGVFQYPFPTLNLGTGNASLSSDFPGFDPVGVFQYPYPTADPGMRTPERKIAIENDNASLGSDFFGYSPVGVFQYLGLNLLNLVTAIDKAIECPPVDPTVDPPITLSPVVRSKDDFRPVISPCWSNLSDIDEPNVFDGFRQIISPCWGSVSDIDEPNVSENSLDFMSDDSRSVSSDSDTNSLSQSSENSLCDGQEKLFFHIEVRSKCEYDYIEGKAHKCCAMTAVALLYALKHKIVYDWNEWDIQRILDIGSEYYDLCQAYHDGCSQRLPTNFLKPYELLKEISFEGQCYDVIINELDYSGRMNSEMLHCAFEHLDFVKAEEAILVINGLSYGLLIYHLTKRIDYVLFDVHGRTSDGERFGGHTVIMFFDSIDSIVKCLLEEFPFVEGFELYPIDFTLHNVDMIVEKNIPTIPHRDYPCIQGKDYYRVVVGDYSQFWVYFPEPHHQCTAMSAAAIAYLKIKSIEEWDNFDLNSILLAGHEYYHFNLEHLKVTTRPSQFSSYLEAIKLIPHLEIGSFVFKVEILNDFLAQGHHDNVNTLADAISSLERNKIIGAIITYKTYSYALIRCPLENGHSHYVFFDSHGRDNIGGRPGNKSAILFFNNAEDFISFFLKEFPLLGPPLRPEDEHDTGRMLMLIPIQVIHSGNKSIENGGDQVKDDDIISIANDSQSDKEETVIRPTNTNELFFDILLSDGIEREKTVHHLCAAASLCAIALDIYKCIDEWSEDDLELLYLNSCRFWTSATRDLIEAGELRAAEKVDDLPTEMELNGGQSIKFIINQRKTLTGCFVNIMPALQTFFVSLDQYAILEICQKHYALIKCRGQRGRIALYDVHGRKGNGEVLWTAIYFVDLNQMLQFLSVSIEDAFPFTLYTVKIRKFGQIDNASNRLFESVISGRFAQNDCRFGISSRNNQCTANSLVFLAYTSRIGENWQTVDIDRILMLGDSLYSISYAKAIKVKPRKNKYIGAHEVIPKIAISTDGWRTNEVIVVCERVMELSGNFGRYSLTYIKRFFDAQNSGVFISSDKAVALYKAVDSFVLFDPHARNRSGFYCDNGQANIFHFPDIPTLHQFLIREGYSSAVEFTLTAFRFKVEETPNRKRKHSDPINLDNLSFSSEDDIPIINLIENDSSFSSDDDIPLINFIKNPGLFTSKDLPLRNDSQEPAPSTVWSEPIIKREIIRRDGNSNSQWQHDRTIRKRKKKENDLAKKRHAMDAEEEKEKRRLWKNYLERIRRVKAPRQFKNADEYISAKEILDKATDDAEVINIADLTVATVKRDEERIRQRLRNRELHPTHFLAFGNHENIDEKDEIYTEFHLGPKNNVCPHCKALYFNEERTVRGPYTGCCMNGTYSHDLPQRQDANYPQIFRDLLVGGSSWLRKEFLENILHYNNVFSFGSLGASDVTTLAPSGRIGPIVTVRGMIYHVAEHFRTNDAGEGLPRAQLYYLDNATAVDERMEQSEVRLNRSLLRQIEVFLRANNPYAMAFRMLRDVLREVRNRPNAPVTNVNLQILRVRESERVAIRRNHGGDFDFPTSNEVAAVHTDAPRPGTANIVIFPPDEPIESGIAIGSGDPNRDSYLYPILFPFSEQTWTWSLTRDEVYEGPRARKKITARNFYSYIFHKREGMYSPLLNAGKLTQQFIIDSWARVQEHDIEYQQSSEGQRKIRSETYGALLDYIENKDLFKTDLPGKVIPMPTTFVGSRQYIREKYLDAMAVCSKYKKPTYFVTLTCNPFCKDIIDNIPKGANPIDYADEVSRIFKLQVDELADDIQNKHVLGICEALIYVIEQQKRSSGHHAHMIVFIQEEDRPANAVDIDGMISAEIPDPVTHPRLHKAVTSMMYHNRCGPQSNAWCMKPRKNGDGNECSKKFPKQYCEQTVFVEKSYPKYRRRCDGRTFKTSSGDVLDNRWIVPYNPYLLLKYNCHLNVELISSIDSLKYLFKYFHKGMDMSKVQLQVIDGEEVYNEFKHYVDCRYLSAMAAYWRLASFDIHFNSHVVYRLPVHLADYQRVIVDSKNIRESLARSGSELLAYFNLNQDDPIARRYLYTEIPYHYVYQPNKKSWKVRERHNKPLVTRLCTVNYNNLELYSLRLLLMTVRGARSYEDLRYVNGVQYNTFHDASIAAGLHADDGMQVRTFEELALVEMPNRLRCLFANLLIYLTPKDPLELWNRFKECMCTDYMRRQHSKEFSENLALRHISPILTILNFSNSYFKLPEPVFAAEDQGQADNIASEYLRNRFDPIEQAAEGLRISGMFNDDQKAIFDRVISNFTKPNGQKLIFVDGPDGTGKTFLNQGIVSTLRGMGLNCVVVVWTGMGASLYNGGKTVHSTFKLPLDIHGPIACNISNTSTLGAELRKTDVLIWDEISMIDKFTFNAVDDLFRELKGKRNVPFGGIAVSASGDFRQILPIVANGSRTEILNRLVKKSSSWKHFEKHALKLNMCLSNPADFAFGSWLIDVGDGKVRDYPGNQYYSSYVKIPSECIETESLVDSIYGKTFKSSDIRKFADTVILSTHHEDVKMINQLIYDRMTEDVSTERVYFSIDETVNAGSAEINEVEFLNTLNPSGMPLHELRLKVNCIIMLLRNLNPYDGFCNGTRLLVKKLYDNCIVGEVISGPYGGSEILIPRIRMTAKTRSTSEELERVQFPVQLCFGMTVNKSQSQGFNIVGLFFRKAPFAHGQLYVALSRTRSKENLKAQIFSDSLMGQLDPDNPDVFIPNIVYDEALE